MKLQVNFDALHDSVRRMGANQKEFVLDVEVSKIDLIDTELKTGISIGIDEIEYTNNGLLSYKGRQVLLYIQDHGSNVEEALQNGAKGKKYHVAYCKTLDKMRNSGRFERYVVKNDISGNFYITGSYFKDGMTRLKVCKNCLYLLNYQGYQTYTQRSKIFNSFSLDQFFTSYQSHFKHKPKRKSGENNDGTYSDDWPKISRKYRNSVNWVCESCGVNLINNTSLLHTHHKDGVKINNSNYNLLALCIECHKKQANHGHLKITFDQKQELETLRREQRIYR